MYAAATDNRQPSAEAAIGWANALDDRVNAEDGKAAIDTHRATSTDWLMPAHVNAEVRRMRKARTDAIGELNPPADLGVADDTAWVRAYVRAIGDGKTPEAATEHACRVLDIPVPAQIDTPRNLPELGRLVRRVPQGVEA
jgi:hypothetical protein